MQRILHVTGSMARAGAETMLMNLYRSMDRTKYQFDFVSFTDVEGDYDQEIRELGGIIHLIIGSNPIKRMYALKKLLKEHPEYKVIHCHTLLSNAFHLRAAKKAKVPYRIAHAHSSNDIAYNSSMGQMYKRISLRWIDTYATHFIGCGIAAASFLFPKQKDVFLLPNAIDIEHFSKVGQTKKKYLKKLYRLEDDCLKIIQVGRIGEVKNHMFSLQIASDLKEREIKFKMFFVGEGSLREDIENEIHARGLRQEVLLLGLRTDIAQLMAGSDVMLMPSIHEGFPVVLVESQSVGIPALISNTISSEVDLNVGLIEFESLDATISNWTDRLIQLKSKTNTNVQLRLNRIAAHGFDIKSSAHLLSGLYKSMK